MIPAISLRTRRYFVLSLHRIEQELKRRNQCGWLERFEKSRLGRFSDL